MPLRKVSGLAKENHQSKESRCDERKQIMKINALQSITQLVNNNYHGISQGLIRLLPSLFSVSKDS